MSAFGKTVNVNEDYVTRTLSNKPPSTPEILTPKILKALESDSGDDEEDDESASSDDTQPANSKSFDFDIEQKTNDTEDNIFEEIENQVEEETTNEESTPEESPDQETPDDSTTPEESQDDVTNDDTTEDDSTPEENPEDSTPEESQEESVDTAQSESSITSTYDSVLNEVTGSDITKYSEFYSSTDSESTGSYEIEGVTSSFVSDGINMTSDVQSGKITLNTNRETGAITGTITNITEGEIIYDNINLSGNIDDESSFYIEDDLIGVKSGTAYTAISISDGMDENDNFITLDDDSSWGYWTAKLISGETMVTTDMHSTWIAGIKTDTAVVQSLIDSGSVQSMEFKGKVIGITIDPSDVIDPILLDSTNTANFTFDFGGGNDNFTGHINFYTVDGNSWRSVINSGDISNSGFSSSDFDNNGGSVTIKSGNINGSYFGNGSIKSIGGNFNMTANGNREAIGVFKAEKQ